MQVCLAAVQECYAFHSNTTCAGKANNCTSAPRAAVPYQRHAPAYDTYMHITSVTRSNTAIQRGNQAAQNTNLCAICLCICGCRQEWRHQRAGSQLWVHTVPKGTRRPAGVRMNDVSCILGGTVCGTEGLKASNMPAAAAIPGKRVVVHKPAAHQSAPFGHHTNYLSSSAVISMG
jgi:hypothetical protein